jgi:hypothetical protein
MTERRALALLITVGLAPFLILLSVHLATAGETTLSVIERMPRHHTDADEPREKRERRMFALAEAIDAATPDPRRRAALLTLLRFESGAAAYVQEGRCFDGPRGKLECDAGRAKGPWQLQGSRSFEIPDELAEQARIAASRWGGALRDCGTISGAFARYGRGNGCDARWAHERAAYFESVRKRL